MGGRGIFYMLCGYINSIHIFPIVIVTFTINLLGGLAFGIDGMSAQRREFMVGNVAQGGKGWGLGSSVG